MDGINISFSDTFKYLGVTLDRKLTWKHHIYDKLSSCKRLMLMINAKLKGRQATKPKLSKWAYAGVIRPKLLYGCMIWGKALKLLDRLATRATTMFQKNAPQASIELLIDLIPIELMIKKAGISSYIRLKDQLLTPTDTNSNKKIPHLKY